jgi:hypothetical protein
VKSLLEAREVDPAVEASNEEMLEEQELNAEGNKMIN